MILLTSTSQTLTLDTSATAAIHYTVNYVDITTTTFVPGTNQGTISSAATTNILSAPAASTQRQVKFISFYNADATTSNTLIIYRKVSSTSYAMLKYTLTAGETLQYTDSEGFVVFGAAGGGVGVTDGDRGDITVSGSGETWSIDNGVVSLAKQADVASSTVFYRKTTGTGAPEVQTLATLKTDLGLTGSNSGDQTSIVGISSTKSEFDTACSDGEFVYQSSALGTPSSGTLTNCTGLPDGGLTLSDVTTNDVSTTKHGFVPKAPNDSTKYLNGLGAWATVSGGGATHTNITSSPQTLAVNTEYTANSGASLLSATLPATCAEGDTVTLTGNNSGLWKMIANTGQTIKVVDQTTSSAGALQATSQWDCVSVKCVVANTTWVVYAGSTKGYTIT